MEFGCCGAVEQSEAARVAGFDYVEPTVLSLQAADRAAEVQSILSDYQTSALPVKAFNVFLPKELKVVGPDVDWTAVITYVTEALRRVQAVGADRVVFGSGASRNAPAGFDRREIDAQLVRFLQIAGDAAEPLGITIVIEPLNRQESNTINSVAEGVALAQAADHPAVRVLADLYHMQLEEEPVTSLTQYGRWLHHVHVADTGRFAPGSGDYPYRDFFSALHEIDYSGLISVECQWRNFEEEAPQAVAYLQQMWLETV